MRTSALVICSLILITASLDADARRRRHKGLLDIQEEGDQAVEDAQERIRELERKIARKELPPIEFEFNKADLKEHSKIALDMIADILIENSELKLMVFGHTCDVGSEEYNDWLSQKRAESVKTYLITIGVYGEFVKAKGFGERKPLVPNDSEEDRATNRRVEFVLTKRWWDSVF